MAGAGKDFDLRDNKNPLYALTNQPDVLHEHHADVVNIQESRHTASTTIHRAGSPEDMMDVNISHTNTTVRPPGIGDQPFQSSSSDSDEEPNMRPSMNSQPLAPHSQDSSPDNDAVFENMNNQNAEVSVLPQRAGMIRKPSKNELENTQVERICPRVNCPEKIILCVDISPELAKETFRTRAGDRFTPFKVIKRALRIFLNLKQRIDSRHEYALVVLHDSAQWVHDFTRKPRDILNILEDLTVSDEACDVLELGSIFDTVNRHVSMPVAEDVRVVPPPYVVRTIMLYGRSYSFPSFYNRDSHRQLILSPYFFFDAYYIHEPPSETNRCEDIYNMICDLDESGLSYIHEVSRNPTKLYDCMAQLLGHPLQRPLQKDCDYDIEPEGEAIYR